MRPSIGEEFFPLHMVKDFFTNHIHLPESVAARDAATLLLFPLAHPAATPRWLALRPFSGVRIPIFQPKNTSSIAGMVDEAICVNSGK